MGPGGRGRSERGWAKLFARRESGGAGLLALVACGGMGRAREQAREESVGAVRSGRGAALSGRRWWVGPAGRGGRRAAGPSCSCGGRAGERVCWRSRRAEGWAVLARLGREERRVAVGLRGKGCWAEEKGGERSGPPGFAGPRGEGKKEVAGWATSGFGLGAGFGFSFYFYFPISN